MNTQPNHRCVFMYFCEYGLRYFEDPLAPEPAMVPITAGFPRPWCERTEKLPPAPTACLEWPAPLDGNIIPLPFEKPLTPLPSTLAAP